MKITEKQLRLLVRVLEGSLLVHDRKDVNIFGISYATRQLLYNNIHNQQSDELIDVKDKKIEKPIPPRSEILTEGEAPKYE